MPLPARKNPRLNSWDYSSHAIYFVTFCTHDHECILGQINGTSGEDVAKTELFEIGRACEEEIKSMAKKLPSVEIERYVVMPNHVHLIVSLGQGCGVQLGEVVRRIKARVSKRARLEAPAAKIWQRGYHDHVIRDEADYLRIVEYVENNPRKWELDVYHPDW